MDWRKYLFMKPFLELISQGLVFKKIYGVILKVLAALTGIGGLIIWIFGWKTVFSSNEAGFIPGGIIVELLFVVLIYSLAHILLIRAKNIESLPEAGYMIIPIVSLSFKLIGELYACLVAFRGIGGGIFIWLTGSSLGNIFPGMNYFSGLEFGGRDFLGGLSSIIAGALGAFGILILSYFLAELTVVLVDIVAILKGKNGH